RSRASAVVCTWSSERTRAQWIVIQAPALHPADRREQLVVIRLVADRIDRGRIDDEKRRRLVIVKEPRIRLVEPLEVVAVDLTLVLDTAPCDALHQHIDGSLQVQDEVRLGSRDIELRVHLLVECELRLIERDGRKQPILLEQVVRDAHGREEVLLVESGKLLRALKEEIELCRERTGA